ncbi:MAG: hypothetical protein A2234_10050 [Elusimicrobia bacterium RIFOXYA2_FULL_58_8]|nr:MAG: hypothetical protein A2234_10050 [Elusimicrobia bacterium RIFOXYA2_FULL_58_8]
MLSNPASAQETVAFKLIAPSGKLKLTDVFTVQAEASLPPGYAISPDTASVDTENFELLSFTKTGSGEKDGRRNEVFEIKAQAFALGASTFPAITWNLYPAGQSGPGAAENPAQAKSPAFQLEVLPLFESKPDEGIRDIYPPLRFIPWHWLLLAAAAVAAAAWLLYRKFRRRNQAAAAAAWKDSRKPYQRARDRLDKLAAGALAGSGKLKEFYIGLTSILRFYLAEEFSIDAALMTTADLARELKRTGTDIKTNLRAREFLQKADLVKFAKLQPKDAAADTETLKDLLMDFTHAAEKSRTPAEGEGK